MIMTRECSSTADAITGVLLAGDAVENFSPQPLNATAGTHLNFTIWHLQFPSN